ncbi:MAG TPA: protein kinase [Polyangia bacterium]
MQPPDDLDAWVAAGRYPEAAAELRRRGELERAQALYEKIWDFRAAAEVARERGDRPSLLRLLIDAKELAEAAQVGHALLSAAPGEQARAAEVYERRRMWAEAATLREALGQLAEAQALYRKAQQPLEAARIDETLGRAREAGIAYEKLLSDEPGSADAPRAHLRLGRILAGFQRHEEAVRHLQKALATVENPEESRRARRALTVELAALGYRDAAAFVLGELRASDPKLPPLDPFLAAERRAQETARSSDSRALLGGRYLVDRLLGSGGMGRVYLARDQLTSGEVAVKVVAPPADARLAEGYRRFVREAKVVSSLRHPNLVGVIAFHEELGLLAMEYMAGGTLADRLPGPLSLAQVRALLVEVVSGLEAAHAHGVIHRDIKPANIFFAASGEAKLGDFGVAHLQDLGATQTAGFIGTLAYMSPEQISGAPLTFVTDIYALGVTAFQALTGRLPFSGPDFVAQHLGQRPPLASSLRPGLPGGWDALIARALEKAPAARFSSLEELRRALLSLPVEAPAAVAIAAPAIEASPEVTSESRYTIGGVVAESARGVVYQATDTRLGREVVIERFTPDWLAGDQGAPHLAWLRALARHGGPRLQRILRITRLPGGGAEAVFEAVAGPRPSRLTPAEVIALAHALEPLHAAGIAHGAIADSLVVEEHGPILLCAGRAPKGRRPEDDLRDLDRLTSTLPQRF